LFLFCPPPAYRPTFFFGFMTLVVFARFFFDFSVGFWMEGSFFIFPGLRGNCRCPHEKGGPPAPGVDFFFPQGGCFFPALEKGREALGLLRGWHFLSENRPLFHGVPFSAVGLSTFIPFTLTFGLVLGSLSGPLVSTPSAVFFFQIQVSALHLPFLG